MRLSTKGRMAVMVMVDLGLRAESGPVSLAALSRRHGVSVSYLEQFFSGLRKQGLVRSTRGPGGGYSLAREAAEISVADIILAVDNTFTRTVRASAHAAKPADELDPAFWGDLHNKIWDLLGTVSLASLVADQTARGVAVPATPVKPMVAPVRAQPRRPVVAAPNSVFALARFAR